MPLARPILSICLIASVVGCAQFPELDAAVSEEALAAPAPRLVDNRQVLDPADALVIDEETQEAITARTAALQAEAEALGGPLIAPEEARRIAERTARLQAEAARVAPDGGTR